MAWTKKNGVGLMVEITCFAWKVHVRRNLGGQRIGKQERQSYQDGFDSSWDVEISAGPKKIISMGPKIH